MPFKEYFSNKNVLISGHTGFKGSWLTAWMKELNSNVTGISLDPPTNPSHFVAAKIFEEVNDLRVDIRCKESFKKAIHNAQPDFLFHLAAQPLVNLSYSDPVSTYMTNIMGTLHLLEALRELNKNCIAILITSDKCYENQEWIWGYRETDRLGGRDPYSASKGATELVIRSHIHSFFPKTGNIRIGIGRAGNVIGGGDWAKNRIVPDCVRAWSQGNQVKLRNPSATRPWQHVLEPLSGYINLAMVLSETDEFHGEAFNFGPPADQNHSVGSLVNEMSKYWKKVQWSDDPPDEYRHYESGLLKLNCDKALQNLKWRATWNFECTIQKTVEWYKIFYEKKDAIVEETNSQIHTYQQDARNTNKFWAQ